jgi:SAM-dependent methyltransferase
MLRDLHVAVAKAALRILPAHSPRSPDPARKSLGKAERQRARGLERARMEYDDEREYGFLNFFESAAGAAGDTVLDLGCGYGGRIVALERLAKRRAIGLEVKVDLVAAALRFARERGCRHAHFVTGVGEAMPLGDETIDAIVSYDVLEHVQDPARCLAECLRVLKPGGRCFLVFPPYYHPTGSHLEGYVSRLPYANVLFPSRVLIRAVDEVLAERGDRFKPGPLRPGDRLYWLNGLTVRGFDRLVARSGFEVVSLRHLPLLSPMNRTWKARRMRYYAWLVAPLARVPWVREYFTHRIVAVLRKPEGAR